jgi:tRNA dimethylallyltransferase
MILSLPSSYLLSPTSIPILAGPTASGKTELALRLAQRVDLEGKRADLEVVSADASMVYRGMDIGTAKPSLLERSRVRHHLLDIVEPDSAFSVADFVAAAEGAIADILARGNIPLLVGGTGYYLRALSEGLYELPRPDLALQSRIWAEFEQNREGLLMELGKVSPADLERVGQNPRRLVRAIEVLRQTGIPPAQLKRREPKYPYRKLILWPPWNWLEPRLEARIQQMLDRGLVAEVEQLLRAHPSMPTALQAIGYKEMAAHLRGELSLEQAKDRMLKATRAYARRQYTWFRKEPGNVRYVETTGAEAFAEVLEWLN